MSDPTHQNPGAHDPANQADGPIFSLCELDGQALDALLAAKASGIDQGPVPAGLSERSDKVIELLALLDQDAVQDPPADLTSRTMEAVTAHEQRLRFSQQVQMLSDPRRSIGVNWHQLFTAAAVFIIGATLLMPVMERQQADSRRIAGASNMSLAGQAMSSYAADNLGQMPRGDVRPGMVWWNVGQSPTAKSRGMHSNSAHLYRLVRLDYITASELACPENAFANSTHLTHDHFDWSGPRAVSFSYQNQYTDRAIRLEEAPDMAVLADRNPLFKFDTRQSRIIFNINTPINAPSRAHGGTGQNVLTANGVVTWRVRPNVDQFGTDDQDNIWAANGIDVYTGTETQADPFDSFLVP
jgi:hypothetical protein